MFLVPSAFVVHFTWEMLQDPLYAGLSERLHGEVRNLCLMAAFGDAVITLIAFYAAAWVAGSRFWFANAGRISVVTWFAAGLLITIGLELYATRTNGRWSYGPLMPIVPGLRVGLAPLLQWIAIPAILWRLMDRNFRGSGRNSINSKMIVDNKGESTCR